MQMRRVNNDMFVCGFCVIFAGLERKNRDNEQRQFIAWKWKTSVNTKKSQKGEKIKFFAIHIGTRVEISWAGCKSVRTVCPSSWTSSMKAVVAVDRLTFLTSWWGWWLSPDCVAKKQHFLKGSRATSIFLLGITICGLPSQIREMHSKFVQFWNAAGQRGW